MKLDAVRLSLITLLTLAPQAKASATILSNFQPNFIPSAGHLTLFGCALILAVVITAPIPQKPPTTGDHDRLLKVAEVSQLLGYSRATIYRLIALGKLPVVKVAGTIRFRYQSLCRWMEDHETPPSASTDSGNDASPPAA